MGRLPTRRLAPWLIAVLLALPLTPALAHWAAGLSGAVLLSELCGSDDGGSAPDAGRKVAHGCPHACCAMSSPAPLANGPACVRSPGACAAVPERDARSVGAVPGLAEARAPPATPV